MYPDPSGDIIHAPTTDGNLYTNVVHTYIKRLTKSVGYRAGGKFSRLFFTLTLIVIVTPTRGRCWDSVVEKTLGRCHLDSCVVLQFMYA